MIPDNLVDEGLDALIDYLAARTELIAAEAQPQYGSTSLAVLNARAQIADARDRVQDVLRRIGEPSPKCPSLRDALEDARRDVRP